MNTVEPIASLFPGSSGRTVEALARVVASGGSATVALDELAGRAGVAPHQVRRVLVRLAMSGLVEHPTSTAVTVVVEHVAWAALTRLSDPQPSLEEVLRSVSRTCGPVAVAVAGPVAAGTARSYADALEVAVVVRTGELDDADLRRFEAMVGRATGNVCRARVVQGAEQAAQVLPVDGFRVLSTGADGSGALGSDSGAIEGYPSLPFAPPRPPLPSEHEEGPSAHHEKER